MKEYRVGLLGMGMIGTVHAHCINALPFHYQNLPFRAKLTGVYNRTYEKASEAVKQYGFEFAAKTIDELISRDDIDVIDICLPNHLHEECVIKALEAGKHVYCEKPLCVSYEGALRMEAAAKKSGKKIQLAFNNRFYPAVMRAKELMDEGRLGRLLSFEAAYNHSSNIDPNKAFAWRFSKEYTGGGTLADMGSHVLDMITYLAGDFSRINAVMQTAVKQRPSGEKMKDVEVEDAAYITAQLKNGAMGTISASKLATGTNEELYVRLYGDKGALRFDAEQPGYIEFYDNTEKSGPLGGERGFKRIESCQRYDEPGGHMPPPKMTLGWLRSHVHSMYSFFDCIYRDVECEPSLKDGIYNQYLLEKAYESAEKGTWINL